MNTLVSKAASVALAVLLCRSVVATTCAYSQAPGVTIGITQINYIVYNAPVSTLDGALSIWMSGCNGQGSMYPSLSSTTATLQGPAIVNIGVSFQPGTSSHNTCGDSFMRYDSSGSLIGGTIIIFDHQVDGNGVQTPCASLTNFDAVIAHELGHTLGLADLYSIDPNSPGLCSGALMSDDPEELYPDECKVADSNFFTPAEDSGSQPPAGGGNPDGGCPYGAGGCVSPIVINLDRGAYHLTGANQNPVSFDINADGQPDVLGWTAAGFNEGFLALD